MVAHLVMTHVAVIPVVRLVASLATTTPKRAVILVHIAPPMTLAYLSAGVWELPVQAEREATGEAATEAAVAVETRTLLLCQLTARHPNPLSGPRSQTQLPSTRPLRTQLGLVLLAHL